IAVPFFGRDAMTAPALAQLAYKYDLPVWPARTERLKGCRFRVTIYPRLELPRSGDAEADVAEAMRREAGVEPDKNQSMALANVLAQAGNAWLLAGQAKRARRALNQALALAPEDPDMLVDRAVVAAALEDFGTALADLDLALAHEADHVEAHAYRASALHRLERRPEALAAA
ncbi:MAG: hypothetical protein QF767_18915, partial [Alphaproteobacteria bacterium]|nr:hypothetical protein [Alphaproteobacteria bacterium]